jgi:hypothetical protein
MSCSVHYNMSKGADMTATTAGPFILVHRHPPEHDGATGWERRWACGTLEEAKRAATNLLIASALDADATADADVTVELASQVDAFPESGGSISLPDGSEIVVEATTYRELHEALPPRDRARLDRTSYAAIREHYNARFGTQEATS